MHAPLDALSSTFIKTTCKRQAWVGSKHDFAGISWWHVKQVEQGSMDMTQSMRHQVEGPIMQENESTRAFERCNSWNTRARKSRRRNDHAGGKWSPGEAHGHPGRSAQAGRPASPTKGAPRLPSSAGKHPSPSSVCVLKFLCPEPL
jgi:hypothetical protein